MGYRTTLMDQYVLLLASLRPQALAPVISAPATLWRSPPPPGSPPPPRLPSPPAPESFQARNTASSRPRPPPSPPCTPRATTRRSRGTSPSTPPPTPASPVTAKMTTRAPIACKGPALPPTSRPPGAVQNSLGPSRSPPAFSHSEQPFLLRCD